MSALVPAAGDDGAAAQRGSDAARRFDPPLRRFDWVTPAALDRGAFVSALIERSGWSRSRWERVLWHGGLQLDGRPTTAAGVLDAQPERDGLSELPAQVGSGTRVVAWSFEREPEPVALPPDCILLDAEGVVAVCKPGWLTVQGSRASQRLSLEAALRERLGGAPLVAAHRLDRETSGVCLFARDAGAAGWLGRQLREHSARRSYLAVVAPPPLRARWEASGWLLRAPHPRRFRFALAPDAGGGGRWSHTRFERLAVRGGLALVRAEPSTGRTHQLRVHLAACGSPILGDVLYGGAEEGAERLQLHAHTLTLCTRARDPEHRVTLVAPPPGDFVWPLPPAWRRLRGCYSALPCPDAFSKACESST